MQVWNAPWSGTEFANLILKSELPDTLTTLRTKFSGASAPSNPVAGQWWYDTTNGLLHMWDGAAWQISGPSNALINRIDATVLLLAVNATTAVAFFRAKAAAVIENIGLLSDTATVSSSGNEWQWGLRNVTQAVELFSGTVGTFTTLGGVGGGELAIETAYDLIVDQNPALAAGDVLRFTATLVGAPTGSTLGELAIQLGGYYSGT